MIPHELRRELRGMWTVAAWVNHADARAPNTLGHVGHRRWTIVRATLPDRLRVDPGIERIVAAP
jgi:hypothetical protein